MARSEDGERGPAIALVLIFVVIAISQWLSSSSKATNEKRPKDLEAAASKAK